jgi:threonylcarbamoyladenosine tRNA methylthiotransferase MtaB
MSTVMSTVCIETLGCKVNQFESESLRSSLEALGYSFVPFGEPADITIINTCTVTQRADFQSRQLVRRASRFSPQSLIIVTGCYADTGADALSAIAGVKHVLGNVEKLRLHDLLPAIEAGSFPKIRVSDVRKERELREMPISSFHRHTRAFLKIQDGCDAGCAYCIVPHCRGPSRSLDPEKIVAQLAEFSRKGYKEVVLTGIHIGAYGRDLDSEPDLEGLVAMLERSESPPRIRLSSVEPSDFTPGLITLLSRSEKICPHLHVPAQSGDDLVLKAMHRTYDRAFLSELVQELSSRIADLCLGTDLIAGFPGESDESFERTRELIEALPFAYVHVFPFSRRKGTRAFDMPGQVDAETIRTRAEILRRIGGAKRRDFLTRFLGRNLRVLVEDRRDRESGGLTGLSRNYISVVVRPWAAMPDLQEWINREWTVQVTRIFGNGVEGRVVEE